jgi:hypothetical protein
MILPHMLSPFSGGIAAFMAPLPVLATVVAEDSPLIIMVILTTFLAPPFLRVAFGSSTQPIPEPATVVEAVRE